MEIIWSIIGSVFVVASYLLGWRRGRSQVNPSATEQSDCLQVPLQYKLEPRIPCEHKQWAWAQIPVCQTCLAFLPWPYPTTAAPNPTMEGLPTAQEIQLPADISSNSPIADGSRHVVRLTPSGTPYLWVVEPSCALIEES